MARPSKGPPAPSSLVPALLRLVRERDAEGATLLALRLGLDPSAIEKDEIPIAEEAIEEALEGVASALSEPHLALRMPADLPLRRYGLAELAARSTTTVREGLERLARYASLFIRRSSVRSKSRKTRSSGASALPRGPAASDVSRTSTRWRTCSRACAVTRRRLSRQGERGSRTTGRRTSRRFTASSRRRPWRSGAKTRGSRCRAPRSSFPS